MVFSCKLIKHTYGLQCLLVLDFLRAQIVTVHMLGIQHTYIPRSFLLTSGRSIRRKTVLLLFFMSSVAMCNCMIRTYFSIDRKKPRSFLFISGRSIIRKTVVRSYYCFPCRQWQCVIVRSISCIRAYFSIDRKKLLLLPLCGLERRILLIKITFLRLTGLTDFLKGKWSS